MITQFNRENLANNLPDAFRKTDDSNNSKILALEKGAMDKLREAIKAINDSLDLSKASGKTLDMYGEMVGQERGKATDNQYRVLIKSRIARNLAGGDYNSVIGVLALIFGCDTTEVSLSESGEACKARLDSLPFAALNQLVIDVNTALKIVREVMPAGVYLESVTFTGTFEFSGGTELVYDENAGFADEAQTIGGTFGHIFSDESANLPV